MKLRRVLVIYKKSLYQVYAHERKDDHVLRLLSRKHSVTERFSDSHEKHNQTLALVKKVLKKSGIAADFVYRASTFSDSKYDLVMTVGGDGTFLDASHRVLRRPILGINSNTKDSVGMFCGATAENFEAILDKIRSGTMKPNEVRRLRVKMGKEFIRFPVLNDVLIAHSNPGATSRYILLVGKREEDQKSSGIWVAPAAGSTAAIRGAGGKLLPVLSKNFQYLVREPYHSDQTKLKLVQGILGPKKAVIVYSKMRAGRIYLDGPHHHYHFRLGERLRITNDAPVLKIFGVDDLRRKKFAA